MNPCRLFKEHMANEEYRKALDLLNTLHANEQVACLASLSELIKKNDSMIDLSTMKIMSVLHRKLKPGKTYEEFFYAWLPPSCDPKASRAKIKEQFIDYWRNNGRGIGVVSKSAVFHAENLHDPSEIMSVGLVDMSDEQFNRTMINAAAAEEQRGDTVHEVADTIGDAKVYKMIETITW